MLMYSHNPHMPKVRRDAAHFAKFNGVRAAARRFGVSPGTVSKWVKKARRMGYHPIETKSSRPQSHPDMLSKEVVAAIIAARVKHNRCAEVVHEYLKRDGVEVSLSSVKRVLKRFHLLKEKSKWKRRRTYPPRPDVVAQGDLVEFDTVHLPHCYVYTAIDIHTRWGFAMVSGRINAKTSVRFFRQVRKKFPIRTVQTDNGSEFGLHFSDAVKRAGAYHRHIHPRSPNENGHVERFNRTLQEETLAWGQGLSADAISKFLTHYNEKRLHMGLKYKTPAEMLKVFPSY